MTPVLSITNMLAWRHGEGVDACDGSCKRCEPSGNQSLTINLEGFEPPRTEYDSNSLPPQKNGGKIW